MFSAISVIFSMLHSLDLMSLCYTINRFLQFLPRTFFSIITIKNLYLILRLWSEYCRYCCFRFIVWKFTNFKSNHLLYFILSFHLSTIAKVLLKLIHTFINFIIIIFPIFVCDDLLIFCKKYLIIIFVYFFVIVMIISSLNYHLVYFVYRYLIFLLRQMLEYFP